jgi:Zn-dependent protease
MLVKMMDHKTIKVLGIKTSKKEMIDLLKSWLAISVIFAIIYTGLKFDYQFLTFMLISGVTVGIGFLFHELAHKFTAQYYGCVSEFRSSDKWLVFGLIFAALFNFVFFAPGAVMIYGRITNRENGIISLAGPLTNYVLALIFLGLSFIFLPFSKIFAIGFWINSFLGLFNLLPFLNFDGKKILYWNRYVWLAMVILGIIFVFVL